MLHSLTSRILILSGLVVISIVSLIMVIVDASSQSHESFRWVTHSAEVIEATDDALLELRDAESGQRGFILTGSAKFAQSFDARIAGSRRSIDSVAVLTRDNPVQNKRARQVQSLIDQRIKILQETLNLAKGGDFDKARENVSVGHGRELMETLAMRADAFLDEERALQKRRIEASDQRLTRVKRLALIGGPTVMLLVALVSVLIIIGIRRPMGIMHEAMAGLGDGNRDARVTVDMGSREFASLAHDYNAMVDQLDAALADQGRSERELQVANAELLRNSDTLRKRGEVIELLGGMAHRMQASRTDKELSDVIRLFVPRVLPGVPGALYAHNNSRNLLVPITGWGGMEPAEDGFAPNQCWALRRGQSHFLSEPGSDIVCSHVADKAIAYHCEPLLAGGEIIGTLYLEGRIDDENRFHLTVLAENIASALFNHQLQHGLREQTIRDPLTGLFNRRYMEETLALEIARSSRSGQPLSLIMCDVDHFKRFNDEFGHDAGDAVLHAVATELRGHFREGDVVCRFGGEEFTVIAPGFTLSALANRTETVRQAISEIALHHAGRTLGPTSMSFGLAAWDDSMDRSGTMLIQAADAALYRAKRAGRNRVEVAAQ